MVLSVRMKDPQFTGQTKENRVWRLGHTLAAVIVVTGTVVHAWLIQGTMESLTKGLLCLMVLGAAAWAVGRRGVWRSIR